MTELRKLRLFIDCLEKSHYDSRLESKAEACKFLVFKHIFR